MIGTANYTFKAAYTLQFLSSLAGVPGDTHTMSLRVRSSAFDSFLFYIYRWLHEELDYRIRIGKN
jgi:hypothetical protein